MRPSTPADLGFVTALERDPANRDFIGQWTDSEHLAAIAGESGREHWVIEADGAPAGYLIAYDARPQGCGIYVKRLLVADKERGVGTAALSRFLDEAFTRRAIDFAWLMVFDWNARAQAVYARLGFVRFEAPVEDEARYAGVDAIRPGIWRMRIESSGWRSRAR